MSSWYLVKENWKNISDISMRYGIEYIGLGGDIWPHDRTCNNLAGSLYLSGQLEEIKTDTEIEYNNMLFHVHAPIELESVAKYFNSIKTKESILMEIQLALDEYDLSADGFDFGNPEGGYSIIETEIILKGSKEIIDTYLNKFGLFKSIDLMHDFISGLEEKVLCGECEVLDGYVPVAIKKHMGP